MYTYFLVLIAMSILNIVFCIFLTIKAKLTNNKNLSYEEQYELPQLLGIFSIFCFVASILTFLIIPNSFDYVMKVNKDFLNSGRLIYSEDEAIKFKIIDLDLKDSYYVKKDLDKVNFKFEGNKLTTILKDASCKDIISKANYFIHLNNTRNVLINGTPASFILRSEANKDYECLQSKDKEIKLEVEFNN